MTESSVTQDTISTQTRTFWLSFCDSDRPKGQQFLGVAIVDVTTDDLIEAASVLAEKFPNAMDGAEAIAAATGKAWKTGCNPGGEIKSVEITGGPPEKLAKLPRHRLLSKEELRALGQID